MLDKYSDANIAKAKNTPSPKSHDSTWLTTEWDRVVKIYGGHYFTEGDRQHDWSEDRTLNAVRYICFRVLPEPPPRSNEQVTSIYFAVYKPLSKHTFIQVNNDHAHSI